MMNDFLNLALEIAKENGDVLAVMLGLPMLAVVGLGIVDVVNKVKGVFQ